jgi:hypothetical protein
LKKKIEDLNISIDKTQRNIRELETENSCIKEEISFLSRLAKTITQINNNLLVDQYLSPKNPLPSHSITPSNNNTDLSSSNDLIHMNSGFEKEDTSKYLYTPEERANYLVHFKNGKLCNYKNEDILDSRLLYVLDNDNNLYAVPSSFNWNHSWLLAGCPVKAAGFIETDNQGEISLISNESGHYTPNMVQMLPSLRYFAQQIKKSSSPNKSTVIYESHDKVREGTIISYRLNDIAKLNGVQDIHNILHKLPVLGRQHLKKQEIEIIGGYDTTFDNSSKVVISRFGLGPSCKPKE